MGIEHNYYVEYGKPGHRMRCYNTKFDDKWLAMINADSLVNEGQVNVEVVEVKTVTTERVIWRDGKDFYDEDN